METVEHLREVNFTLSVYGDGMDMFGVIAKAKGMEAATELRDNYFDPGELHDDGDRDDDNLDIEISNLDELGEYLTIFKDFNMSLSQSAEVKRNDNRLMQCESTLQNESRNRQYENWNRHGSLRYDLSIINKELTSRINKAIVTLNG